MDKLRPRAYARATFRRGILWLSLLAAVSCAKLKSAEVEPQADGGLGPDASVIADGDVTKSGSDGGSDLPPPDFGCETWTLPSRSEACKPRTIKVVEDGVIDANEISIARTSIGRVGIVYNREIDGLSGETHVVHFLPNDDTFVPAIIKRAKGPFDHTGYVSKIAAFAPDTLRVVSHDVDDGSQSGEVVVFDLVNGAEPLTAPALVASGVSGGFGNSLPLAIAVDAEERTFVSYRLQTGSTAKLAVKQRERGGAFKQLPDVAMGLTPGNAAGTASASLIADRAGQVHLLYHHCDDALYSTPRYHTLDASEWSYRKTIDNNVPGGFFGFSPRIGVWENRKVAVYFSFKSPSTLQRAELRLATWERSGDAPSIELLDQSIPFDDATHPAYRVAMAVDRWGLIHLVIVRPSAAGAGYLEYKRQARGSDGTTTWLSDIIDPDVISDASRALVDLVVDDRGRPHIAYVSGKDLKVRYATRYDR